MHIFSTVLSPNFVHLRSSRTAMRLIKGSSKTANMTQILFHRCHHSLSIPPSPTPSQKQLSSHCVWTISPASSGFPSQEASPCGLHQEPLFTDEYSIVYYPALSSMWFFPLHSLFNSFFSYYAQLKPVHKSQMSSYLTL